jgi:thiamine biosynthesis lipoprotein ApbE
VTTLRSDPESRLVATPVFVASDWVGTERLEVTVVASDAGVVEDARDRMIDLLARFDAADPTSELGRLNAAAGSAVSCSWETLLLASLLDEAVDGDVVIDTARSTATVIAGRRLHPGRIASGVALDMVVRDLEADGVMGAGIRLGRDLRVIGTSPYAGGWTIDVAGTRWRIPAGAAITVDAPAADADTDATGRVDSVTVLADTAWQAAAIARRAATRDAAAASRLLTDAGTPGLLVVAGEAIGFGLPASSQVDLT